VLRLQFDYIHHLKHGFVELGQSLKILGPIQSDNRQSAQILSLHQSAEDRGQALKEFFQQTWNPSYEH
jgi:hypothetical protein